MNNELPRMTRRPTVPTSMDEVADWRIGSDTAYNYDERAEALADLALRKAADARTREISVGDSVEATLALVDAQVAQVYATLALDARTASAAHAWPGIADSLNGTIDDLGCQLAALTVEVADVRPRPVSSLRRIVANYLRRRPADG